MATYDVLFQPLITIVVEEGSEDTHVVGAEVDWSSSFVNVWENDDKGHNEREVVEDHGDSDSHPTSKEACDWMDSYLSDADPRGQAALLRRIADMMDGL